LANVRGEQQNDSHSRTNAFQYLNPKMQKLAEGKSLFRRTDFLHPMYFAIVHVFSSIDPFSIHSRREKLGCPADFNDE
jgi:hypothetical protein